MRRDVLGGPPRRIEFAKETWIEQEEMCHDVGKFSRRFVARDEKTNEIVKGIASIPDTYFTIPVKVRGRRGYLETRTDDNTASGNPMLVFVGYKDRKEE